MKRALRRHHRNRLKSKRINLNYWCKDKDDRLLGISINTPCPCSCFMCGNPRKYYNEVTRQEKRCQDKKLIL